jgi:hypothetical protein
MGAGFLQDLNNQSATQEATAQFTMPTYQGGGYTTTQGDNFNYTTPDAPYAGMYTAPVNINAPRAAETTPTPPANPFQSGGQVYYDPAKGQYYTQNTSPLNYIFGGGMQGRGDRNYIGSSPRGSSGAEGSFENPSPLPNYSMYIAPEQMPNINAYLNNPNSLLSAMQSSGVPSSGAGRFSNLLSTNTTGK